MQNDLCEKTGTTHRLAKELQSKDLAVKMLEESLHAAAGRSDAAAQKKQHETEATLIHVASCRSSLLL